jgi:exosortase
MDSTAATAQLAPARVAPPTWLPIIITTSALALVWLAFVRQLQLDWSFNPQYSYGWSVPFIAIYLFWRRWNTRPLTAPNEFGALALALCAVGAFVLLPVRFVAEANPDWRLLDWATALITVGITMSILSYVGGLPWCRHFAFPVLFLLVAVPWPVQFEQFVIQNLMRFVTAVNVALLNIIGVPALQHGNLIELGSGMIGIEEACSGVRSLQATLMISLFLGELYYFNVARRLILVIAGMALALFCNLVRTFILVWLGAKRGADAIHAWHDPAGLTILLVCLFGLWILSLCMRRGDEPPVVRQESTDVAQMPTAFCLALCLWFVCGEAATQFWYRSHQSEFSTAHWTIEWPSAESNYQKIDIPPESAGLLRYDDGGGVSWKAADSHRWNMYFFRWLPGHTAALFVKVHRPDICLPASGLSLTNDHGTRFIDINGLTLPVRSYRFDHNGIPLHVFYCYADARSSYKYSQSDAEEDWTARGRIRSALQGHRETGAQMLELAVWGYDDDAEAEAALRAQLAQIVRKS